MWPDIFRKNHPANIRCAIYTVPKAYLKLGEAYLVISLQSLQSKVKIKTFYARGKGPTQERYSSSRPTAVMPLAV